MDISPHITPALNDLQVTAILEDLKWRLHADSVDLSARDKAVETAHSDYVGRAEHGAREEMSQAFRIDPAGFEPLINQRLLQAESEKNWYAWSHFTRWKKILTLVEQANTRDLERRTRENIKNYLHDVGFALHVNPISSEETISALDDAFAMLEKVEQSLGKTAELTEIK